MALPGPGKGNDLSASLPGHGENQRANAIKYSNYSMESSDKVTRNWASGSHLLRAGESRRRRSLDLFIFLSVSNTHSTQH